MAIAQQRTPGQVTPELHRSRQRKQVASFVSKGAAVLLLSALSIFILFPIFWMISTSLKANEQVMVHPPVWIPKPIVWANYAKAWVSVPFTQYTINTTLYAVTVVIGQLLSNSLAAYGFAKLRFPGRTVLFGILIATLMIPGMVTMIPQYILFSKVGWIGSYLPLIVPAFFGSAFYTFMLRQFYLGLPNDLMEAARIDGANELYIWWRVYQPLAKPALATVAIWAFEGAWNDYVNPVLYLSNEKLYTLQIGLSMFKNTTDVAWQYIMAASVVVMIPVILLYALFQNYFVEGAALSGIKG